MKTKTMLGLLMVCSWILSACQFRAISEPSATSAPLATAMPPANTVIPSDTPPPVPTETATPTETLIPASTPLPEGVLFRDDFDGELQPGWRWENENPRTWTFTDDGWLQITGEPSLLLTADKQNNLLWYPLPDGDFMVTVHLKTRPFRDFQQAAIYIYEDSENFITINRGFCAPCVPGGNGFFMDYKVSGQFGTYRMATDGEDVFLRLESKDTILSGYYATAPGQWERLGRFGNYFKFTKVGIGVSNGGTAAAVVGQFDYFEISLP